MFGGDSSNPVFPTFIEEGRFQYDTSGLPQLQLFGDCEFFLRTYYSFILFGFLLVTDSDFLILLFCCTKMFFSYSCGFCILFYSYFLVLLLLLDSCYVLGLYILQF